MTSIRNRALFGVTLLLPLLGLTPAAHAQGTATATDCDRLIAMLQQNTTASSTVTLDQARTYKNTSNNEACRGALSKMPDSQNADARTTTGNSTASNIVVQQAAPTISVQEQSPQVTVQQEPPTVSITPGQPEIIVRQGAPVVTIDIPKPEITLRMPKPTVEVAQAAPQVVVNQAKPEVTVVPPKSETDGASAKANVNVAETKPTIRYESEPPQVHVNQAQGEPTIKIEQIDRTASAGISALDQGPHVMVSELTGKSVMGPQGQKLGTVKAVILDGKNHAFLVVNRTDGNQPPNDIPIPAENARLNGNQVMIQGLSLAQINSIREYKTDPNYHTVLGDQAISMARS